MLPLETRFRVSLLCNSATVNIAEVNMPTFKTTDFNKFFLAK